MKRIWFKKRYVVEILGGLKRNTVRRYSRRTASLKVGERVALSVGTAKPFATVRIACVTRLTWDDLSAAKQAELERLGIEDGGQGFLRVDFDNVMARVECLVCGAADGRCKDPERCEAAARRQERAS